MSSNVRSTGVALATTRISAPARNAWLAAASKTLTPAQSQNDVRLMSTMTTVLPWASAATRFARTSSAFPMSTSAGSETRVQPGPGAHSSGGAVGFALSVSSLVVISHSQHPRFDKGQCRAASLTRADRASREAGPLSKR